MNRVSRMRRLFVYDAWANHEALGSLSGIGGGDAAPAVRLLAHVAAAKQLWLARIVDEPAPLPVWPELDAPATARALAEAESGWGRWLSSLDDAGGADPLARVVTYVNSRGERWSNAVEDILDHVVLHGHYHRGQIAARVRAAGGTPAVTDFTHAIRTLSLPPEEIVHG
ncbi:MAG TPA: DinB family protein [Gemmatimonadales bacterium]|nr:DinB family protein [Gemmatimonadales bacterium]